MSNNVRKPRWSWPWLPVLVAAFIVAALLSPFASSHPDGLERVAEDYGFAEQGERPVLAAWIPDYVMPGIGNASLATSAAGVLGTVLAFAGIYGFGKLLLRRPSAPS
ncbi:PDGLE domain-containing protein [Heliophilum fasciatum]|uniref:Cobalt/nickel transport protein n=1 Tax=Heliophilum fasciatum TaxID=35700 RepID=A0A4R2RPD6_9FIRM|nr:PDGLE domain-containing protein [Heliophilum fasciatum]MCW2277616.1 cobalt/nickel transport protein [Heliophilum fasciatum]TCP64964.1 cobalt/nickel transport protein [Heliophilum fasciatum]